MEIIKTDIEGLVTVQPKVFEDDRGYFMESFKLNLWEDYFPDVKFIQENESKSKFGVLRGMHFQKYPYAQSKLIRVVKGKIQDVVVDLRKDSLTFGETRSFILSDSNKKQLFIPRGFAHGFLSLSKEVVISYKVDNHYSKTSEDGIHFNDQRLSINWKLSKNQIIVNDKDRKLSFNISEYQLSDREIF